MLMRLETKHIETRHPFHENVVFDVDFVSVTFACDRCDGATTAYVIGKWGNLELISCRRCGNTHTLSDTDLAMIRAHQKKLIQAEF